MSFVFQVWFQNSRARAKKCHLYSRYGSKTAEPGLKVSFVFQVWFQNSRARAKKCHLYSRYGSRTAEPGVSPGAGLNIKVGVDSPGN